MTGKTWATAGALVLALVMIGWRVVTTRTNRPAAAASKAADASKAAAASNVQSMCLYVRDHQGRTTQHGIDARQAEAALKSQLRGAIDGLFRAQGPLTTEGATGVFWLAQPEPITYQVKNGDVNLPLTVTMKMRSYRYVLGTKDADFRYRLESRMNENEPWSVEYQAGASSTTPPSVLRDHAVECLLNYVRECSPDHFRAGLAEAGAQ
jgi:hypothetical protein